MSTVSMRSRSYLAFDIDLFECSTSSSLEHAADFLSQNSHVAVFFLKQIGGIVACVIDDELCGFFVGLESQFFRSEP